MPLSMTMFCKLVSYLGGVEIQNCPHPKDICVAWSVFQFSDTQTALPGNLVTCSIKYKLVN